MKTIQAQSIHPRVPKHILTKMRNALKSNWDFNAITIDAAKITKTFTPDLILHESPIDSKRHPQLAMVTR